MAISAPIGSGNIGATNVLRTGNRWLAALTLLLDAGKAAAAVLIVRYFVPDPPLAYSFAGIAAFVGHLFPVWLRFKGGKGVAAYIGAMLGINWIVGLLFCVVWLFMALTRRIFLACRADRRRDGADLRPVLVRARIWRPARR